MSVYPSVLKSVNEGLMGSAPEIVSVNIACPLMVILSENLSLLIRWIIAWMDCLLDIQVVSVILVAIGPCDVFAVFAGASCEWHAENKSVQINDKKYNLSKKSIWINY